MFVMDVPPEVPPQYAPIVVAQASQTQQGPEVDRTIGVCHLIENTTRVTAINSVNSAAAAWTYLRRQEQAALDKDDYQAAKMTLLEPPKHGELEVGTRGAQYVPADPNYSGPDNATVLVEIGGYKLKVLYFFKVMPIVPSAQEEYDPYEDPELCPNGHFWRISLNPDDPSATLYTIPYPDQWSGLLAEASKVTVTFADLPGETLGQRLGNTITLDVDAAGHGWFVDETPWDNAEYVATSNLNAWVAKDGSEAAGQMDLLSVLLHEYGHVLGLTHNEAAHTLMSDSLESGERHTVSVEDMEAIYDHLDIALPSDPNSPFNPLPWSTSLLFGFTRLRRDPTGDVQGSTSAAGGGTPGAANGIVLPPLPSDPNATCVTPAPIYSLSAEYQEALHTGLYNGDFALFEPTDAFYGWDTRGQISLSDHERGQI